MPLTAPCSVAHHAPLGAVRFLFILGIHTLLGVRVSSVFLLVPRLVCLTLATTTFLPLPDMDPLGQEGVGPVPGACRPHNNPVSRGYVHYTEGKLRLQGKRYAHPVFLRLVPHHEESFISLQINSHSAFPS